MIPHIKEILNKGGFCPELRFSDASAGSVDMEPLLRTLKNQLERLREPQYFERVEVDPELGTVCWPNGVDFDPPVLYAIANGAISEEEFVVSRELPHVEPYILAVHQEVREMPAEYHREEP